VQAQRVFFRQLVAFAFLRDHVQQSRAVQLTKISQHFQQIRQIVSVHRAVVVEAEFLEQGARHHHAFHVFFDTPRQFPHGRHLGEHFFAAFAGAGIQAPRQDARQVLAQRADVGRNRHVVVVQNHQHVGFRVAGVIECLERQPGGHRTVADYRHHVTLFGISLRGDRHTQRGADGGAGMAYTERVVLAFRTFGKWRQPALAAYGRQSIAAPCEDLVGIGLVADIPDQAVVRCVEHRVQGHCQLDGSQTRAQMAAAAGHRFDHVLAKFVRQRHQFGFAEFAQLCR
jgi:hypothetical protein